jgi:hypothetical protein
MSELKTDQTTRPYDAMATNQAKRISTPAFPLNGAGFLLNRESMMAKE